MKCDRQFPCGACTRRGAADDCFYQRHDKTRIEDPGVLERRLVRLCAQLLIHFRMEALEKLVRGLVGEAALQQIKDGSYEAGSLTREEEGGNSSGEETAPLQRTNYWQ